MYQTISFGQLGKPETRECKPGLTGFMSSLTVAPIILWPFCF